MKRRYKVISPVTGVRFEISPEKRRLLFVLYRHRFWREDCSDCRRRLALWSRAYFHAKRV